MATTATSQALFFVESNLKWNPLLHTSSVRLPKTKSNTKTSKLGIKCFFTSAHNNIDDNKRMIINQKSVEEMENKENPMIQILDQLTWSSLSSHGKNFPRSWENLGNIICKALKGLQKSAAAALLVGVLVVVCDPRMAFAASGGRMGGRSFSSRSSSSSRTYTVPRMDDGMGLSYSSAPYFAPSPFGGGSAAVYVGPAIGVGSSFSYVMMGLTAFVLVSSFLSGWAERGVLAAAEKTSVVKIQVGLLGMAKSLQADLNRIAEAADTSSPEGLHSVLTETIVALLRHPSYCISACSSVDVKQGIEEGEKQFNQFSIEERGKFDEETLVNVNNIRKQTATAQRASRFSNEYIVITILVAAEGLYKLPAINSSGDLKDALEKLASIPSSRTMAVEVLWTPQNENDTLSERELLKDYPLLQPL